MRTGGMVAVFMRLLYRSCIASAMDGDDPRDLGLGDADTVLVLGIEDHAHGTLYHLGGDLGRLPHFGSILN